MLKFENVKIGREIQLFEIDNFELTSGCYAIIAPNGAGKTTFLHTLLKQINPISGQILVNNQALGNFSNLNLAREVAFVGSRFEGIENLSVKNHVALGRSPYTNMFGYLSDSDQQIIDESIANIGLTEHSDVSTDQLSDGMRQLCAIALALAQQTKIILLDEPTAFLDFANKTKVMQVLTHLAIQKNLMILMSSHDLDICNKFQFEFLYLDKETRVLHLNKLLSLEKIIDKVF